MSSVRQNPLIKVITALTIFFVLVVMMRSGDDGNTSKNEGTNDSGRPAPAVPQTSTEEIAALSGYVAQVEQKQQDFGQKLDGLVTKADLNKALASNSNSATDTKKLREEFEHYVNQRFGELKGQIVDETSMKPNEVGDVNAALGYDTPFETAFEINTGSTYKPKPKTATGNAAANSDEIVWVYPLGFSAEKDDNGNWLGNVTNSLGGAFSKAGSATADAAADAKAALEDKLKPIPFYTLHKDSSIHGATAFTALVGRIEREGSTHEPFKFQIALSAETLMANGIELPNVANAIVSGIATGDRAFNCVRGKITSFSFNFSDGRIFNQAGTFENPLGSIGDQWGNPCVRGELVDDVGKVILAQSTIGGLASVADTISKQQQAIVSDGGAAAVSLTGSAGKLAAGSMLSGGLNKTGELLAQRYESYYEAIYVPPGQKVTLFFDEQVAIDYMPTNRVVNYEKDSFSFNSLD